MKLGTFTDHFPFRPGTAHTPWAHGNPLPGPRVITHRGGTRPAPLARSPAAEGGWAEKTGPGLDSPQVHSPKPTAPHAPPCPSPFARLPSRTPVHAFPAPRRPNTSPILTQLLTSLPALLRQPTLVGRKERSSHRPHPVTHPHTLLSPFLHIGGPCTGTHPLLGHTQHTRTLTCTGACTHTSHLPSENPSVATTCPLSCGSLFCSPLHQGSTNELCVIAVLS